MGFGVSSFVKKVISKASSGVSSAVTAVKKPVVAVVRTPEQIAAHNAKKALKSGEKKYNKVAGNKYGAVGLTVVTGQLSAVQVGAKGISFVNQALSGAHTAGAGAGSATKEARETQGKIYGKPLVAGTNLVAPGSGSTADLLAKTGILSKIPGIKDFASGYLGPQQPPEDLGAYEAPQTEQAVGISPLLWSLIIGGALMVISVIFLLFRSR